jgi:predicted nucleic acid-binding protein
MTRWLLDTSVLIDHLRCAPAESALLEHAARDGIELWSVVLVRTELLAGMRTAERRATHKLLDQVRWLEVTRDLADQAGELARRHLRSHRSIDTVDCVIAAAALALDADLKTTNVKHFPIFPGLRAA